MSKVAWVLLGIVIVLGGWVATFYNSAIRLDQEVSNQWAKVETQYQRRFDLVPNLEAATKGALKQEKEVFGAIADARTRYGSAKSVEERVTAANQLEGALSRLLVVVENYPQLNSTGVVRDLMAQLEGTENRISVERSRYNDAVTTYDKHILVFPGSALNAFFKFAPRSRFEAQAGAATAPKINL